MTVESGKMTKTSRPHRSDQPWLTTEEFAALDENLAARPPRDATERRPLMTTPNNVTTVPRADRLRAALPHRLADAGPDVPVRLWLLEIPQAVKAAEVSRLSRRLRVPALAGIDIFDDARAAFDGVTVALFAGAPAPRAWSGDLLEANGGTSAAGRGDQRRRQDDALVVGNPANTNASSPRPTPRTSRRAPPR